MENIINLIIKKYDNFTTSHRVIADYIIENSNYIIYDTLNELASKIGVSTTSIIRFAKDLGLSGYSELLEKIRDYASLDEPYNASKTLSKLESEEFSDLFSAALKKDIENLNLTLHSIKKSDLKESIRLIKDADNVYITGYNDSFTMAYYMALRLAQVRNCVDLLQPVGGMYPFEISEISENDVIVAFWFPRYSIHTLNMINHVRKNGGKAIIITSSNVEKVKSFGDVILPTHIHGVGVKESIVAPISLANYLVSSVALEDIDKSKDRIDKSEVILQSGYYLDNK